MSKKNGILAVGSVALDTVETPFGKVKDALGGSATFFSASARFFSPVSMVAVVGSDFPKAHIDFIKGLGIQTAGLEIQKGKTFRWSGYYGQDMNQAHTLKTELNVFQSFRPKITAEQQSSRFVFLANIDPDIQRTVLSQVQKPELTACDTMNFWITQKKKSLLALLKKIDIFFCNDAEARGLSQQTQIREAAAWLLARGPRWVVIKKGEHGVLCFSKNFIFSAPAYLVDKAIDPTGAGDSFAGGFMGYLASVGRCDTSSVAQATAYGSVMASFNVEDFGVRRLASLRPSDVKKRFKEFQKRTCF